MFDNIFAAIEKWMRELLTGMVESNMSTMFTDVNEKTSEIAAQVGRTPQNWNSSVFSMIQNLSESVVVPIAGIIITLVLCYELISMLTERNNLHDVDTSDTIKPRLERCGADCRKVAFINEETYSGLTLDDERIRQAIIEFRPRLVVIDPIQAYLGSDSDLQIAGRARKLMQRLGMWASVYDCAIVLIGHLNKKEGTKGLYRSLGSIDVVAAARSVLQVERDQKDTDIRIVRQIKNSLAPSDGEIRFSITAEMGFQWVECKSTFVSSEQPKVPEFESKTEKAAYLIKRLLSDGDMRAREIYMRMKDEGISRRTAENTKKELGIRSYRKMRQWYWSIHTGE